MKYIFEMKLISTDLDAIKSLQDLVEDKFSEPEIEAYQLSVVDENGDKEDDTD